MVTSANIEGKYCRHGILCYYNAYLGMRDPAGGLPLGTPGLAEGWRGFTHSTRVAAVCMHTGLYSISSLFIVPRSLLRRQHFLCRRAIHLTFAYILQLQTARNGLSVPLARLDLEYSPAAVATLPFRFFACFLHTSEFRPSALDAVSVIWRYS
jgi:hypothetical protein